MILPAILFSPKVTIGLTTLGVALLAVAETTTNRTLIICSLIGSGTTLVIALVGLFVSRGNRGAISELKISLDGGLHELMEAKEAAARSAGKDEERADELGRQGATALAQQKMKPEAPAVIPAPVIVENPPEKPAHVKQQE